MEPAVYGTLPFELLFEFSLRYDLSYMKSEHEKIFKEGRADWIGINYYQSAYIKPYTKGDTWFSCNNSGMRTTKGRKAFEWIVKGMFERTENPNVEHNAWDMENYPQGLYQTLMEMKEKYNNIPAYVTENGLGLHEMLMKNTIQDDERIKFMSAHIQEMLRAKADGADVRGYYVWSTFDLYSWVNGYDKRYGLVYVDFTHDLRRTPKRVLIGTEILLSNTRMRNRKELITKNQFFSFSKVRNF